MGIIKKGEEFLSKRYFCEPSDCLQPSRMWSDGEKSEHPPGHPEWALTETEVEISYRLCAHLVSSHAAASSRDQRPPEDLLS